MSFPSNLILLSFFQYLATEFDLKQSNHDNTHSVIARTPRVIGSSGWIDDFKANNSALRSGLRDSSFRSPDESLSIDVRKEIEGPPESPRVATLRVIREAYRYYSSHAMNATSFGMEFQDSSFVDKAGIRNIFGMLSIHECDLLSCDNWVPTALDSL